MERQTNTLRLLKTIWNRRWLILTTILAFETVTLWWVSGLPPVYESSVVLAHSRSSESDLSSNRQETIKRVTEGLQQNGAVHELIQSDLFKEQRAAGASPDRLAENLLRNTSIIAEPKSDGFALRLRYRDRTPDRAQRIAGSLSEITQKIANQQEQSGTLRIEQSASLATGPIMPRRLLLTEVGMGVGALLGLVFAAVAEWASKYRNGKLLHNPGH